MQSLLFSETYIVTTIQAQMFTPSGLVDGRFVASTETALPEKKKVRIRSSVSSLEWYMGLYAVVCECDMQANNLVTSSAIHTIRVIFLYFIKDLVRCHILDHLKRDHTQNTKYHVLYQIHAIRSKY